MATQRFPASNDDVSNNDVAIDIPGDELLHQAASELGGDSRQLARPLFWAGSCTLVTVFNRIIYRLPPGAIFVGHQVAYYLTLFAIFLAGVAEVYAATLLGSGQRRACARPLLCAAVVLLAFLIAFGGTPVLVMGMG